MGIIAVCSSCDNEFNVTVRGNGNLLTSKKTVFTFEKIITSGSVEVRYYASEEYRVVVTIDENLHEYLEIFTRNNTLNIGFKRNVSFSRITKYFVEVYCPFLTGISSEGDIDFEGMDTITTSTFRMTISGSGKIKSAIECESFSAKISGFGEMTITGSSKDARIDISGSGIFSGENFITKNTTVNIDGFGIVYVFVIDNLKANISGSGTLYYWGDPKVESHISGFGKIIKK
jgi:hypothetical protein